ncbi:PSPB protein, partial [Picathartes gymnocephalus]|nr:PSPB protein [Picathartes gymnocephalus]
SPPGRVVTMATGLGAPGRGCGVPPSAWCQDWVTALRCGALGRCPHLAQGHPDMDICAACQQLLHVLHQASNQSAVQVPAGRGTGATVGVPGCHPGTPVTPRGAGGLGTRGSPCAAPQKPWQVCATLRLCHGEPGAAPGLGAPRSHPQGSGGPGLSPEALPLPVPLCWLCRTLVARAE